MSIAAANKIKRVEALIKSLEARVDFLTEELSKIYETLSPKQPRKNARVKTNGQTTNTRA